MASFLSFPLLGGTEYSTRCIKRLFLYTSLGVGLCMIVYLSSGLVGLQQQGGLKATIMTPKKRGSGDPLAGGMEQLLKEKNLKNLQNLCLDRMTWLHRVVEKKEVLRGVKYRFQNYTKWKRPAALDLPFLVNNKDKCKDGGRIIVIYVFSAVKNLAARNQIRTTWGTVHSYRNFTIKTVFLLGKNKDVLQEKILQESNKFSDLIQGDFIDSYINVSYKSYFGLKWVHNFCPNAMWVIKTDDDVFLNVYAFIDRLLPHTTKSEPILLCHPFPDGGEVLRGIPKFGATLEEFPEKVYPPYCSGVYYSFPIKLVLPLYACISVINFFKIEDVFTTGIVAHMINLTNKYFINVDVLMEETPTLPIKNVIVLHGSIVKPNKFYDAAVLTKILLHSLWNVAHQQYNPIH